MNRCGVKVTAAAARRGGVLSGSEDAVKWAEYKLAGAVLQGPTVARKNSRGAEKLR